MQKDADDESTMKPYKVQDFRTQRRFGVVAKSYKELIKKGCEKLKLRPGCVRLVLLQDGTDVEDEEYFQSLPEHCVFLLLKATEKWNGYFQETVDKLLDVNHRKSLVAQIRAFMRDEESAEKVHLMSQFVASMEMDVHSTKRQDHPDWFDGVDKRFKTKEDYMKNGAQSRVRGYLKTGRAFTADQKVQSKRKALEKVFDTFQDELKCNDYYGDMFVRTSGSRSRLCDENGWFPCEGAYDAPHCGYQHSINPYGSKEARILFSSWNLDHVIEKSRAILPSLIGAVSGNQSRKTLNWRYFYELLFTRCNLRLVHIACHKKEEHKSKICDSKKFYL